jgi:hypothetical protein
MKIKRDASATLRCGKNSRIQGDGFEENQGEVWRLESGRGSWGLQNKGLQNAKWQRDFSLDLQFEIPILQSSTPPSSGS